MLKDKSSPLLKPNLDKSLQTTHQKSQLLKQFKKNESKIATLSKNVQKKRTQMKNMSKEITIILQKQATKTKKEYPIYNQQYTNPTLLKLKHEKDLLYHQTQLIKKQILTIKEQSSQQIQTQLKATQSIIKTLEIQIQHLISQKEYITKTLNQNKVVFQNMRLNVSFVDLEKKTQEMEQIKKQCKFCEKQIRILTQKELLINQYYFQLRDKVQKNQSNVNSIENTVTLDQAEFYGLIEEINQIYQQRRVVQKNGGLKFKQFQKRKQQIQRNMKIKNSQIRELQTYILRANLQSKKNIIFNNSFFSNNQNQTPTNFDLQNNKNKSKTILQKPKQNPQTNNNKNGKIQQKTPKKMVNKVYLALKQEGHIIYIGQWQPQVQIIGDKDPQIKLNTEFRIKQMNFYVKNDQVVGLKSVYFNKNNQQIQGKSYYTTTTINLKQQQKDDSVNEQKQKEQVHDVKKIVKMQGMTSIEYGNTKQSIYMKYNYEDGSNIQIGEQPDILSRLNLSYYIVKFIEAQNDHSRLHCGIKALKITLENKPIQQQKFQEQEHNNNSINIMADKISTQRSFSNSGLTIQKRIIPTKGKSLKRIREQPIVDYRLMIGKNKNKFT